MFKTLAATALLGLALAAPAHAATMMEVKCDDATMKMMTDAMAKDTDPKMKEGVMKAGEEMKMAMDMMKANKTEECMKHVGMAMDHMMMKHK